MEEKLIDTEIKLRTQQAELGVNLIWATCIICILVGFLPIASGAWFNNEAPEGTSAQIVLSETYYRLVLCLSFPFVIGLTAGIILVKSSVKHTAKSFFNTK